MPLLFEDADFSEMAKGFDSPPPLHRERTQEKSTLAKDALDVIKTGIQTYGEVKKVQIDARRQREINTINAMKVAFDLAGRGLKTKPQMLSGMVSDEQWGEMQQAQELKNQPKPEKQLAPHYGPIYGRGGKYYQSVFRADTNGQPSIQEIELNGEPMQITTQKQAVLERYQDNERAEAESEYKKITTYAAVQVNQHQDNPTQYTQAFNEAMRSAIAKLKNPRVKKAVTELWGTETSPVNTGGGTTQGINPMTGKPYGNTY